MSFEDWQKQNEQMNVGGFEAWKTENESTGISLPTGGGIEEFAKGVVDTFLQSGKGAVQIASKYSPVGMATKLISPEKHEEFYGGISEKIESAREPFEMTHQGTTAQAGRILGNAVGYMGQALAGGIVVGPIGAAMVGFNIEGQQAYDDAVASGATELEAETERLIVGSINAAIEALQIGRLMKFQRAGKHSVKAFINQARNKAFKEMARTGKQFGADILRHSIEEGLEEFAQEGVSMAVPAMLRDDYPVKPDGSPDWLAVGERLGAAAVGGAFAGGVLGAGGAVTLADPMRPGKKKIEDVAKRINESDISDISKARMIKELEKLAPERTQLEIPESTRKVLDIADRVGTVLKENLQSKRPEFAEHIKKGRAKSFAKEAKLLAEEKAKGTDPLVIDKMAQGVAKGELQKDFSDVADNFTQEEWRTLSQAINTATDLDAGKRRALRETLYDLFWNKKPPGEARLKTFDEFFGTDIIKGSKKTPATTWQQVLHTTADVMNVPKAILASFDVSMPLRQAWHYTMAHPIKSIPSWGKMLRAFTSDKYAKFVAMEMQTNPNYNIFVQAGLEQTKAGSRSAGEEYFQGELAHKIPGIGRIIKASERSAVTYMNSIRLQAANHFYELMGSPEAGSKQFQDMIDFVNHSTSRGGFKGRAGKWFKKWSPELGAVFWTPKMIVGKVQSLADIRKPEIRGLVAAETLRAFGGATLLAMLMAIGYGGKVGKDPRSSDFGKVVIGKTRLDMFGTYLPMFRLISQLATGERKAATTGRLSDVDRKEVVTRFLRSKLNPTAGIGWDIWTGETFLGKKVKPEADFVSEYIYEHITPLFIQDVRDAIAYQGFDTLTFVAPLAVHGAGAATYEPTPRSEEIELKNFYANQTYGQGWDDIGPLAQDLLRTHRPEIVKAEKERKAVQEDYTWVGKLVQEQQDAGKQVQKKLPKRIRDELERLTVDVGGLSRNLNSDWYLNNKRYKQYQRDLQKALEKALPRLINNPSWNVMDDRTQQTMLKTQIDNLKKMVRNKIVFDANMKDLEQRKR